MTGFLVPNVTAWLVQLSNTGMLTKKYKVPRKRNRQNYQFVTCMQNLKTPYEREAYLRKHSKRLYGEALKVTNRNEEWELFM